MKTRFVQTHTNNINLVLIKKNYDRQELIVDSFMTTKHSRVGGESGIMTKLTKIKIDKN